MNLTKELTRLDCKSSDLEGLVYLYAEEVAAIKNRDGLDAQIEFLLQLGCDKAYIVGWVEGH